MTTVTAAPAAIPLTRPRAPARPSRPAAWATLARRRISLSAHTPREILAIVEGILKEEDAHWKGGAVPPAREAEYLR